MMRKKVEMDEKLVYRILDEAYDMGCRKAGLFMNGEPFVTKQLPDYIAYAKKKGYEYIYITTNGGLATEDKIKAVIDAGLDSIKFSINAGSRETYKIVHQRDDYDKVMQNLMFTHKYREESGKKFKILSSFVVTKYTSDEVETHYKKVSQYVDDIVFFNAESFAGQMEEEVETLRTEISPKVSSFKIHNQAPCNSLWNSVCVTCEGYLALCCSEAYHYLVIEDVNNVSLKEAWNSERMNEMRQKHLDNNLAGTQCAKCLKCDTGEVRPLNEELFNRSHE
jgi:MoaA/NifB/PqqE/SkfB family radical SAM enzyme